MKVIRFNPVETKDNHKQLCEFVERLRLRGKTPLTHKIAISHHVVSRIFAVAALPGQSLVADGFKVIVK